MRPDRLAEFTHAQAPATLRRSILITANQPFSGWDNVFPDPGMTVAAMIDGYKPAQPGWMVGTHAAGGGVAIGLCRVRSSACVTARRGSRRAPGSTAIPNTNTAHSPLTSADARLTLCLGFLRTRHYHCELCRVESKFCEQISCMPRRLPLPKPFQERSNDCMLAGLKPL